MRLVKLPAGGEKLVEHPVVGERLMELPAVGGRPVELPVFFLGDVDIVLGGGDALAGHVEGRVGPPFELPGHADVDVSVDGLYESLGAGLGDGAEVVEHVGLGRDEVHPMRFDRCVQGVREAHSWTGMLEWGASMQLSS